MCQVKRSCLFPLFLCIYFLSKRLSIMFKHAKAFFKASLLTSWALTAVLGQAQVLENSISPSELHSRDLRTQGRFSVEVQAIGISAGINRGLMAGYSLRPNSQILLKYELGNELDGLFGNYKAQSEFVAVTEREFFGNSFYLEGGLAGHKKNVQRSNPWDQAPLNVNGPYVVKTESEYERRDFGMVFGLGNQWQWSHFTLGCEWVGIYIPFSSSKTQGYKVETLSDGSSKRWDIARNDVNSSDLRLLNLHFGFSF